MDPYRSTCYPVHRGNPAPPLLTISIDIKVASLGWPRKPFDKYWYIGSLIKAVRENIKC